MDLVTYYVIYFSKIFTHRSCKRQLTKFKFFKLWKLKRKRKTYLQTGCPLWKLHSPRWLQCPASQVSHERPLRWLFPAQGSRYPSGQVQWNDPKMLVHLPAGWQSLRSGLLHSSTSEQNNRENYSISKYARIVRINKNYHEFVRQRR